ncbi:MAG: glycosyltransferase family 4 protein [Patescibacteria group bacterium]
MKLIEVVAVYPPYRGGIGTVAQQNARMAAKEGFDVTIATPLYPSLDKKVAAVEFDGGVKVKRLNPSVSYGNAAVMRGLLRPLLQADVIHLHYPCIGNEWLVLLAGYVWRKKIVVTYHHDLVGKGLFRCIFKLYTFLFLPLTLRIARRVFVTSWDYAQQSYLKKYLSKRKQLFSELPCAVDTTIFYPRQKDSSILSRYSIKATDRVVVFVGGLDSAHYFKGVSLLIQVFSKHFSTMNNTHLVIVGDGDCKEEYERQSKLLDCEGNIHFAGSVVSDELPLYYAIADVFVLPSIDSSEAFGIAIIEAQACGKPVITSDLPGVRSVVRHGIDGLHFSPSNPIELGEALYTLLSDEALRMRMSSSARERALQNYSTDAVGKKFVSELQKI